MKLEITKERVLEAAKGCSTAKDVLTKLFPEVFEDDGLVDLGEASGLHYTIMTSIIAKKASGKYRDVGLYLDPLAGHWEIVREDGSHDLVLICRKK